MSTDLARIDGNTQLAVAGAHDNLARLAEWVQAASHVHKLVAPLVHTAFVPDAYRVKVDPRATAEQKAAAEAVAVANATAAVLQGVSLGIDPLVSLQQIYIVHGRPGLYTKMMVALVQSHGHEVWDEDLTDTRAVVGGRRRGSEHIVRITVTMDQARKAGWTRNEAYGKTPQDMLWSRAAARVCDRIASDVLKGIASVEQLRDELAIDNGSGIRTVTPPRRRATPAIAAAPVEAAEPPLDDDGPADDDMPAVPLMRAAEPPAKPRRTRREPPAAPEPPADEPAELPLDPDDDWPPVPAPGSGSTT